MVDPFTSDVIQAALDAAADQMFEVLRRAAMSPIIYEVLDVGTGLTDGDGNLVSSGAGIPSFVGVLDKAVQAIIARHGDEIRPGDVFLTNDPNHGGVTHLNDVVVAQPAFHKEKRVAWAASIAHWGDVGGKCPGSMPVDASDIFAEGLRLPIVRLFSEGRPNKAVWEIVRTNSRLPEFVEGDLNAQIAAGAKAVSIVVALCARYSLKAVETSISDARSEGRARSLAGLASVPHGTYKIEEPQDDGGVWKASISITPDRFEVDLRENVDQLDQPHNTSRDGAVIACQMIFKALTDPERFANAGTFEPLVVHTRPGTIFHARGTAPHGYYFETRMRLFDMLWHCLAKAMPGLLPAGHFATIFGTVIAGRHADTGRTYTMVEPQMGGWGATVDRDGIDAMYSTSHGDTYNCPAEIAEARYGFEVEQKELRQRTGNPTGWQGGRGVSTVYRLRAPAVLSVGMSHAEVPTWSLNQGRDGGINSLKVCEPGGSEKAFRFVSGLTLGPGSKVIIETAHGGGIQRLD